MLIAVIALVSTCRPAATDVSTTATAVPASPTTLPPTATPAQALPTTTLAPPLTPTRLVTAATPMATVTAPPTTLADIVASLQRLPIDEFFEASYKQLLLRDPLELTYSGLADIYGVGHSQLNNLSAAYLRETQALEVAIFDLLRAYDRAALTPEQQLSYDIYEWYLDDKIRGHPFMDCDSPVNSFGVFGLQNMIVDFLSNWHPIRNRQDAEDYVARLSQLDTWTAQVIEGLKRREAAGTIPPKAIVNDTQRQTLAYIRPHGAASMKAEYITLYTSFETRLAALDSVSAADKQALLDAARVEVEQTFIPAYQALADTLEYLGGIASDDLQVSPQCADYYAYALRHATTTDLTPEEVHALGLAEVAHIQGEIRKTGARLGIGGPDTLQTQNMAWGVSKKYYGDAALAEYTRLLNEAERFAAPVFDLWPDVGTVVKQEPGAGGIGAYSVPPPLDHSQPGIFFVAARHANAGFTMPSLTYHEACPGHNFQIAVAQQLDLPTFRRHFMIGAYAEGWALYAERLMAEQGAYRAYPLGNIGRLSFELLRAARLVVDTGLHAQGWTPDQAAAYFQEVGVPQDVSRYVLLPGQASSYTIGFLKILELRERAQTALGDAFDLKEFHHVVLGNGPMPLDILERVVQEYIDKEGQK